MRFKSEGRFEKLGWVELGWAWARCPTPHRRALAPPAPQRPRQPRAAHKNGPK